MARVNFAGSSVGRTIFREIDLSSAEGLDAVFHSAPSTIGIDTIYKSKGKISEAFLRGAGVPEDFITYMRSLTRSAIEFYSCFISYSTRNQDFAERLHADLQAKGVRCWFAPHNIQGGKKLHEQIDEAIRVYDKLLLILSEESMKSDWVKMEITKARKREVDENRRMLFPLGLVEYKALEEWRLLDPHSGQDLAHEIRQYFIPDFSNWKDHDSYQKAFDRLLSDLKSAAAAAT